MVSTSNDSWFRSGWRQHLAGQGFLEYMCLDCNGLGLTGLRRLIHVQDTSNAAASYKWTVVKYQIFPKRCPCFIFKVAQPPRNSLLATGARGVSGVALVPLWTQPLKVWDSWKICMKPVYLAGKSMFVRFPQKRPSGDVINGQEKLSVSSRRMKRTPCAATCEMTLSRTTPTWRSAFLAGVELEF